MKIFVFVLVLAIAVPSLGRPVEEEDEDRRKNTKGRKTAIVHPEEQRDLPDEFDDDEEVPPKAVVVKNKPPFSLHIDIPYIFDLKLFTGPQGHRLGIGVLPGYAQTDVVVAKEKY